MSKLSRNIFFNVIGQGLVLILSFLAVRYVFKQLGEDMLGLIYFALALNAVFSSVFELGIGATAAREVAGHFRTEPEYIRDLIRTSSFLCWSSYGVLAVFIFMSAPFLIHHWTQLESMDETQAVLLLRLLGISAALIVPQRLFANLIRGLERMELTNLIDVSMMAVQQLGILVILLLGGHGVSVIGWMALTYMITTAVYAFTASYFFTPQSLMPGFFTAVIHRNSNFAGHMMSVSILATLHTQSDKVILSRLLPLGMLGYYGFVYSFLARLSALFDAAAQAVFPSFAALYKEGQHHLLASQYQKICKRICLISGAFFVGIPFIVAPMLTYVFNQEIARALILPVVFLCVGFMLHNFLVIPHFFSLAVGRPDISSRANFLALFLAVPAAVVFIYFFGLTGAAFSWIFYHLVIGGYALPRISKECLVSQP